MRESLEDLENFIIDVVINNRRGIRAAMLRGVFRGLSGIYSAVVRTRLYLYRHRYIHDHHLGVPVISVGNLTVGGTGKTPVVEMLAKALQEHGRRVCILSRGYKSKRQRKVPFSKKMAARFGFIPKPPQPLPRIVSDGENVLLDSHNAGDEPFMLAKNCPGIPVVVDKNRVKAGAHAIQRFGADVLVLDDGLQYLKLKHRHDIVLIDKTAPFGNNGFMLPRGTLREPPRSLLRASYIFITKSDGDSEEIIAQIRRYNRAAEIIECRHRAMHFEDIHTGERLPMDGLKGQFVGALSGIAVPESFENGLRKLGAKVEVIARFADHHRFHGPELKQFVERCVRRDVHCMVTTEKDYVRFPKLPVADIPFYFMRVEIEIIRGRDVFDKMVRLIAEPRRVPAGVLPADFMEAS
ncbi:MAG: tetraacyldisaccharide 4'-kinase [Prosthecobacter sp.]|uniref:tetraacyldisaccharide 4'-kinase n=1 Tax=Prosthecobacter sp. TaxID=1965333 RepID=UPI00390200B2